MQKRISINLKQLTLKQLLKIDLLSSVQVSYTLENYLLRARKIANNTMCNNKY